jgi:hypothetical protein
LQLCDDGGTLTTTPRRHRDGIPDNHDSTTTPTVSWWRFFAVSFSMVFFDGGGFLMAIFRRNVQTQYKCTK